MWKSVIGSSSIMSFALLGDSLIYAILPVNEVEFHQVSKDVNNPQNNNPTLVSAVDF